jgi:hypothetical protein
MEEFKEKFMTVTRVADSNTEDHEIDGVERRQVPIMESAALGEEIFL